MLKNRINFIRENKNLAIISLIAVVNAIGFGIVIPILYSYSKKYGLSDIQNGMLFALFSACSFLSTPFIGRLSDKYGRKPLLIYSLVGTVVSFFMAAFAPGAIFLFIARALDGLSAGNIPVASAVISDTTPPQHRARGFGIIGASFGLGFALGPAIAAFTLQYGDNVPFIVAGVITLIATFLTIFFLPETNQHIGQVHEGKIFDLKKLVMALFDKNVGRTLLVTLIYNITFGIFIFAFQPFATKIMHLSAHEIASIFTVFGIVGLIMQGLVVYRVIKIVGEKRALTWSILASAISFFLIFFTRSLTAFVVIAVAIGVANSFVQPLLQTILSKETDVKSQGSILGLSASYMNIGNIVGPLIGGLVATIYLPLPFILASSIIFLCFVLSFGIVIRPSKEHAF